ncbi:hypothetical protein J2129_001859 [Methanofollis sp. W23]|uniref:hypothetical protein n=1 Tax=Methanofollis sp. W23 TaxID=2817849 RepID=UPI001AE2AE58|nr:hypothetical protein [Methanofollis sp. W23]MBP2146405.1 hypothetical protein [Methanofollis sp. W23]
MKGETAFAIIVLSAAVFIVVFLLAFGGALGEEEGGTLTPASQVETPTPTPVQTFRTTAATPVPETTITVSEVDPVVGRWISNRTHTEELLLRSDGTGRFVTDHPAPSDFSETENITWKRDPGRSGPRVSFYLLDVETEADKVLILNKVEDSLGRDTPAGMVFYARAS